MERIGQRPDFLAWLPKAMAVLALLPLIAGFGWLAYITTASSVERTAHWKLVQARVVDPSDGENVRFSYSQDGQGREVLIPRSNGLKGVTPGELIPLHVNPANPAEAEPARGSDLWATPGLVVFFLLFLVGCFAFLWRVKPLRMEIPPELLAMSVEEAHVEVEPPATRFAREMPGRHSMQELLLRQPAETWKANLFWCILPGGIAVSGGLSLAEREWAGVLFLLAGLAGVAWLVRQALKNRSYTLRCDSRNIVVSDRFCSRTIALRDIAEVRRLDVREQIRQLDPTVRSGRQRFSTMSSVVVFSCLDSGGRELLRLNEGLEPEEELAELLRRMKKVE